MMRGKCSSETGTGVRTGMMRRGAEEKQVLPATQRVGAVHRVGAVQVVVGVQRVVAV